MSGEQSAPQMAPVESPHVVSSVKLHILKKGEYTLWSMRMEQYLTNTDYALWQVIMNGDEPVQTTKDENGVETEVPPKTAQALLQRQRERKAKSILLLAIPDEYQLRFHGIQDAKTLWAAIKSRFGGNVESKKMQKNVLKQQFENISVSDTKGLDKSYDRNKTGIDDLDIDDLYNNLKVFEADIKNSSGSSLNSQNVAFLSAEDTNSINEVNTANGVSTASSHNSQGQASSSTYTDDLMLSFFANQSNSPQLDNEDLEQIDHDDLEEMDLKWQVLIKLRLNALTVIEGAILPGNVEQQEIKGTRMEMRDNALIVQDGLGYDWSYIALDEPTEFALMAYTSGSDTEDWITKGKELGLGIIPRTRLTRIMESHKGRTTSFIADLCINNHLPKCSPSVITYLHIVKTKRFTPKENNKLKDSDAIKRQIALNESYLQLRLQMDVLEENELYMLSNPQSQMDVLGENQSYLVSKSKTDFQGEIDSYLLPNPQTDVQREIELILLSKSQMDVMVENESYLLSNPLLQNN
ncbi:hypothetical protein Tco_0337568 [Tanacetum coccineum]